MTHASSLAVLEVAVAEIVPDPNQPRSTHAPSDLAELVESVRARGIIQPLLVSPHPDSAARHATRYMVIAGERRLRAAQLAGLSTVPVFLREQPLSSSERLMLQLDENDGELRRELSLYDRATALVRALQDSGLSKEDFARTHHKSPSWISHYVSLGRIQGCPREALQEGYLTGMVATRLFVRLPVSEQQKLLERARREHQPITPQRIEIIAQQADRRRTRHEAEPQSPSPTRPSAGNGNEDTSSISGLPGLPEPGTLEAAPPPTTAPTAAAGFLDAGRFIARTAAARCRETAGSTEVSILLTHRQLASLLRRLGLTPHGTAADQIEQLFSILG